MSIISDIADTFGEIKKNLGAMTKAPSEIMRSGKAAGGESRFFSRPLDSVARRAKQSILYFPVVGSEGLSAETLGIIAKATQVRAAEYVRLMISNMDPVEAAGAGKSAVISALRGATLKDAFVSPVSETAVESLLRTRMSTLVEHAFIEDGLRPQLHEASGNYTPALATPQPQRQKTAKPSGPWAPGTPPADLADRVAALWTSGNAAKQAEARKVTDMLMRRDTDDTIEAEMRNAGLDDLVDTVSQDAASKSPERMRLRSVPEAKDLPDAMGIASNFLQSGTPSGREKARQIVAEILSTSDSRDIVSYLQVYGLDGIVDEVGNDITARQRREALQNDPLAQERERSAKLVKDTIELANRKIPGAQDLPSRAGFSAAVQNVQNLMATNDKDAIAALRHNKETAKIVKMLETLPDGVVRDGSYDVSGASNKAEVGRNIDFDKLNSFQPVLLDLTIRYKTVDGEPMPITDRLTLGVKAVAHPIPSLDIVTGLGTSLQRDNFILQFFRMTSGETSFLKDFVLNLKVAKARASGKTTSGRKVLETLRRQAEWNTRRDNVLFSKLTDRGFVPPTATMVVTADEVEKIRSLYGVDFSKPGTVRDMLRSHNLMGFIIVDEAIGLVRVFEDGDDDFDRLPISTLKSQGKEASVKDIMTILARS